MEFKQTGFQGLVEIQPQVWEDERGYFFESFQQEKFNAEGINTQFVQANQSSSKKGVVRGLHLQLPPFEQAKLVRAISGTILDIVVDLRQESKTFGKHYKCLLDSKKHNMLFVPRGFAHGFTALDDAVFNYICDNVYNREKESGIIWNDPDLAIDWETSTPLVSEKDQQLPTFEMFSKMHLG
ncbi:MAG: dTDP-4-dehydrorhamnose 3,5-epimerase [Cyclobacteriaceae bacterium]|nr:dTDP-4-dehydrorhamnose 3,5-epimerase [Cyclobacteriaceae bacterium]